MHISIVSHSATFILVREARSKTCFKIHENLASAKKKNVLIGIVFSLLLEQQFPSPSIIAVGWYQHRESLLLLSRFTTLLGSVYIPKHNPGRTYREKAAGISQPCPSKLLHVLLLRQVESSRKNNLLKPNCMLNHNGIQALCMRSAEPRLLTGSYVKQDKAAVV